MLAQHSSASVEHYTPQYVVDAAVRTMGDIDLDPASCEFANRTVKSREYFNSDGLTRHWSGRVFLNPPGGRGSVKQWWCKLLKHYSARDVSQAVFLAFSLEFLQNGQVGECRSPTQFPICIPRKRIAFIGQDGLEQKNPTHANAIIYLPPFDNQLGTVATFRRAFAGIGDVLLPA